jgi:predicted deacylase
LENLIVRNIKASPGEKIYGWLKVAEMQDSRPVKLPIVLINGKKDGPTVYLQAAVDGNELSSIAMLRDSIKQVKPENLSGKIIAVVLTNFFGFHANEVWSPIDKISMNRVWPGRKNGSSSERIVYQLWNEAVLQANYAIDCHSTDTHPSVGAVYVRVAKDEPYHEEAFEMARNFGIGYILDEKTSKIYATDLISEKTAERKLSWNATVNGIPTITPELYGSRGWINPTLEKGVNGVLNVLKWLKMISGEPELPEKQYVAYETTPVLCNKGGFVEYKVELGDIVKEGDVILEVTDPFGRAMENIKTPKDGIIWTFREYPMVSTGERVVTLGTEYKTI